MTRLLSRMVVGVLAGAAWAASTPPLAEVWNIAPSGHAATHGELVFRITSARGDPLEVTVPVKPGASDLEVARGIRRQFAARLPRDRYRVELTQGTNVQVSDTRGRPSFALELLDSNIDELRVAVQSVTPSASPTVPRQADPASARPAPTPPRPGDAVPPAVSPPREGAADPAVPPAQSPIQTPSPTLPPPRPSTPLPQPSIPAPVPSTPLPTPSIPPPAD